MAWTRNDYPAAMKNLNEYVRDKAIDIANAMIEEGYDEDTAIPVAISQAKEWYEDASNMEKHEITKKYLTDHESSGSSGARLEDADVIVDYDFEKDRWQVRSQGAKQVDSYHYYKEDAKSRAQEIASNRDSKVIEKTKEESK